MNRTQPPTDRGLLFGGFLIGLLTGVVVMLARPPRVASSDRKVRSLKNLLAGVTGPDALTRSLQEGREVAQRRRDQLYRDA